LIARKLGVGGGFLKMYNAMNFRDYNKIVTLLREFFQKKGCQEPPVTDWWHERIKKTHLTFSVSQNNISVF